MKFKESETIELKKSTSELKEGIISIVAILNKHKKGELYFGIKNNGEVVGQNITENTLREISKTISDHIEPKIYPKINKIKLRGKNCVKVEFQGNEVPYYAYGRVYIRVGDENKQLSAKEIENIILRKNQDKLRWDNQICENANLNDIDNKTIKNFIRLAKQAKRLDIKNENKELILRKLDMFNNRGLTNAAVLVFGKNPEKFFDNVMIRCGRFKGITEEFMDIKDYQGNLFDILNKTLNFIKDYLHIRARIEGLFRKEEWEIPIEALREALLNALIHRDYKVNSFVYVKIYDDDIVISNPGNLIDLKIKDLYKEHESKLRNPLIAKVFYYTGLIDVFGKGTLNIIKLLKAYKLDLPVFEESGGSFRIKFKRPKEEVLENVPEKLGEKLGVKLGENELKIIASISKKKTITLEELAKKIGISEVAVYKNIKKLKQKGLLKRVGPDKGGYWEILK